ncbi:tetratricopeptide repeat protein [Streptomyces katsurahamanus]|uniref:Tetratricopeptide repeat protein n=1 Tax=Streptomyces katsurahamanus TaxID=2577098 RepID=A0ABW9NRR7_9ACTN|nr:tetratricopeptide repeat protein [Streptomyces katsurahamanus]MQS36005.1 tetratricopeptide repeat protein [Streptomyces katsurahamanus]
MGAGAALTLAAGAVVWAVMTHSNPTSNDAAFDNVNNNRLKTEALLESGLLQARYQDIPNAKATFKRVLALDPKNKLAWYNLGVLAQNEGHRADAHKSYDAALKTDPSYTSALFNKALLLKTDDPDKALTLLRRAVAADPKAATAFFHIGETLARKGRDEQARDAYRQAVELNSSLRSQVPESYRESAAHGSSPDGSTEAGENTEADENTEDALSTEADESTEDALNSETPDR